MGNLQICKRKYNKQNMDLFNKTQPKEIGKQEEKSNKQKRVCLNINEGKTI